MRQCVGCGEMRSKKEKRDPDLSEKEKNEIPSPEETVQEEAVEAAEEKDPMEQKLEEAQQTIAELNDKLLRTLAEYDNFRKRSVKEKEAIYPEAKADAVAKFIPVLDSMERAAGFECSDPEYKKGVDMIINSFQEALAAAGVEEIPAEAGTPFDPNLHNAVMHVENEEMDPNTIAQVFQKGYRMGDRVIRYSMVQVAN